MKNEINRQIERYESAGLQGKPIIQHVQQIIDDLGGSIKIDEKCDINSINWYITLLTLRKMALA